MAIKGGLYAQLLATPAVTAILAAPQPDTPYTGIYFSVAAKGAPAPYVVMHVSEAPPAEASLDGQSELIDGEIQFDSYAADGVTARKLSRAIRDALKNFSGALPDGTTIQFVAVTMDLDDPFEIGGQGYVERSVLRLKALYTEAA